MNTPFQQTLCLTEHLLDVFLTRKDRVALDFPKAQYRYGDLREGIERTVGWFRKQGLRPGDRICVHMVPTPESVLCYLASLFYGAILVPLNPRYTGEETRYFLDDTESRLFLGQTGSPTSAQPPAWKVLLRSEGGTLREAVQDGSLLAALEDSPPSRIAPRRNPDEVAALCYTSGTTGKPKGAVITQVNLSAMAASLHEAWGWTDRDVLLHALPLFHVHGLFVALQGALFAGARAVLLPSFEAEGVLERLSQGDCTLFMGVPTMYHRLLSASLSQGCSLSHMRLFVSGSAPLSPEVFKGFQSQVGHTILERYGMTEAGMVLSNPLEGERRPGSVGFPLPGVSVRIVDSETGAEVTPGETGELIIRSRSVCKGYWKRSDASREAFTAGGWLRSGDLARQHEDGYFYLVGRSKEIIISGGFNVYPKEVEDVLARHPGVRESAVFGMPHTDLGEQVCAAVVAEGKEALTEEGLIRFAKDLLASYKCPRRVHFLEALPRNPMGKVVKETLKTAFERAEENGC
jgi:malonyl-CoA/methylmalonyl-CoA synthetase